MLQLIFLASVIQTTSWNFPPAAIPIPRNGVAFCLGKWVSKQAAFYKGSRRPNGLSRAFCHDLLGMTIAQSSSLDYLIYSIDTVPEAMMLSENGNRAKALSFMK